MNPQEVKRQRRRRRQMRVRRKIHGTAQRPRLAVFRSLKHTYAQIIDDEAGQTLAAASSRDPDVRSEVERGSNRAAAAVVGKHLGQRAVQRGIRQVVLDRRHYRYHGRVRALADAARQAGLEF